MSEHRRRERSGPNRIPPHNLEAEQALLGAAMLNVDAADTVASALAPGDFFAPAHQHIAAAVVELVAAGDPVDVVTVADELRRGGLLELVGGPGALLDMQTTTPAISRAPAYARIVKDAAVLRRLISTAAEIAELGYAADDPSGAVHRAGELLSTMGATDAARLATIEVADIAALLANDLQPEQPLLLTRSDGAALLYAGKTHVFQAEPSSGKTWIALAVAVEVLDAGGSVIYLDYEDTSTGIVGRVRTLGTADHAIADRFRYVQIPGKFGPADRIALAAMLAELNPDLVVIDGVGESLSREGLSEDKADDVLRWSDLLPRWITRTSGAAVLMIDHVAKDPEQRGRWARGSGAKLGAVDGASYQLKVRQAFSRHRGGRVDVVVAKDRPGGVGAIGETVATIHLDPAGAGELLRIRIEPPPVTHPGDTWKPTRIMRKVWEAISEAGTPLTASAVTSIVHAQKPAMVREAITRLIAEGYVSEAGRPKRLTIVKEFRDPTDDRPPAPPPPPPAAELALELDDGPTADELAELDEWRRSGNFYNGEDF